jgi:hypothetical protein
LLLGVDPSKTPKYLLNRRSQWFNRSTLVDFYALAWPVLDMFLLLFLCGFLTQRVVPAITLGLLALYRLNELIGGVFHVLLRRAAYDSADERKMIITVLAYLEPILLFGILHAAMSVVLSRCAGCTIGAGYSLERVSWHWSTIIYYSLGCYTTVGAAGVAPICPSTMLLSDLETITGIFMLASTISAFVSKTLGKAAVTLENKNAEMSTTDKEQTNS